MSNDMCPVCGGAVRIISDGDGTSHYESTAQQELAAEREQLRHLEMRRDELIDAASKLIQQRNALRAERHAWELTAAQNQRNTDYYRGLVISIGEHFGIAARTADDGTVAEAVLCAKVPELVQAERDALAASAVGLREALRGADWIITKLAPHEALAIAVRGWTVSPEDAATGAMYRQMIDAALNTPREGRG